MDPKSIDESAWALRRGALRFVDPEVEREYRRWYAVEGLPFARAGLLASIVGWAALIPFNVFLFPDNTHEVLLENAVLLPFFALVIFVTYRPAWIRWVQPLVAAAQVLAGLTIIFATLYLDDDGLALSRWLAMGGVVMLQYFGYVILPLRLPVAIGVVGSYTIVYQVALIAWGPTSTFGATDLAAASFVPWASFGLASVAAYALDRIRRGGFRQEKIIDAQSDAIARERAKSDALLDNMLPKDVSRRLKDGAVRIADAIDEATILFADIVGFTPLSTRVEPAVLVELLDTIFTTFDRLAEAHGVEKIKTIGDAYMAAAGVPTPRPDHASAVASLAIEMRDAIDAIEAPLPGVRLAVRIGIHTGPVVAGVIGEAKPAYDLWGDAVNVAARMESHGEPGQIHVSEVTAGFLEGNEAFVLQPRGEVSIKGKGVMRTYFLS